MKCRGRCRTRMSLLVRLAGLSFKVRTIFGMVTVVICRNAVNVRQSDFRETMTTLFRPVSIALDAPLHNVMEMKSFAVVTYIGYAPCKIA